MQISKLKPDEKAVIEGTWFDWVMGIKLKIARLNNENHKQLSRELSKPYVEQLNNGKPLDADTINDMAIECLGKTVLLDWENIEDDDGKAIEYSTEKAIELLTDIPELADFVSDKANNAANFRKLSLENAAKN